jgi:hypothetical protein
MSLSAKGAPEERTGKEALLDVCLDATEEERPEDFVERLDHHATLLLVVTGSGVVLVEKALEVGVVGEDLRADEVQEREKLFKAVLERGAGDEQAPAARERANDLGEDAVRVLDPVRLVDDDVLEAQLLDSALLDQAELIRGDEHLEVDRQYALLYNRGTLLLRTGEHDGPEVRRPLLELALPVLQRRLGHDDDVRTRGVAVMLEVGEKRDSLERLP